MSIELNNMSIECNEMSIEQNARTQNDMDDVFFAHIECLSNNLQADVGGTQLNARENSNILFMIAFNLQIRSNTNCSLALEKSIFFNDENMPKTTI